MIQAMLYIKDETNETLKKIKDKFQLRNKSQVIDLLCKMYREGHKCN